MHRAHEYRHLVARWRDLARRARVRLRRLATAADEQLYYVQTPALAERGGVYLSAGLHGDEPAGPEALLAWCEKHVSDLARRPLFILPCLNPWGLRNNIRLDSAGRDLNRSFHLDELPEIAAIKARVGERCFAAALLLHEDYDGQGIYLYEIQRGSREPYWGEELLRAAGKHLPVEPRTRVDTWKAVKGIVRRRLVMKRFERMGYPEAIWLHREHAARTYTVEAPSEFALERRVAGLCAVIECVVRKAQRA